MISTGMPLADSAAMGAWPQHPVPGSESEGGPKSRFQLEARRFRL